jgi:type I restriction enzyme S subunit
MKQGWEIKTLGEIGKVSMCKRVFKEDTTTEGDIPFYKIGTFGKKPDAFITKERYIEFRNKFSFPKKGDILISASGTIGRRVRYDGEPAYFQDSNIVWIDNNEKLVLNDYLYRFYEICNWGASKGATISRLYNDNLKQIEIPFPKSLHEQQRIVAILDEAFAAITSAKANAQQNLQNAKELFESVLDNIMYDKKWEIKELVEVCKKVEYGTSSKSQPQGKLPVLRMGNIQNSRFIWDSLVYSDNEEDNQQYLLKYNDVLFNRTNSPELVGKTAIYKNEMPAIFAGYLIRIHRKEELLDADYLNYYLNSKMAFEYGKTVVISSVNQANINGTKLKTYPIPLPPLKTQQTIGQKLDTLNVETKKLEAIYQQKLNDLEELKKSVLQKAFNGELP